MRKGHLTVAALVALVAASPVVASTFVAMSPAELVTQADAVVQGKVVHLESFWTESGRLIVTEALVDVSDVLVGSAPGAVRVRTFGGQVGDFLVEATGFPRFDEGEEVILFLRRAPEDGSLRVLGYQQGHFRVVTRLDGVTLAVPMVEEGVRFLTRSGQLAPEARSMRLEEFKTGLRQLARRTGRLHQN